MQMGSTCVSSRVWEEQVGSDCFLGSGFDPGVVEMVVAQHCKCTKCHLMKYFKIVYFMSCEFHLYKQTKKL